MLRYDCQLTGLVSKIAVFDPETRFRNLRAAGTRVGAFCVSIYYVRR